MSLSHTAATSVSQPVVPDDTTPPPTITRSKSTLMLCPLMYHVAGQIAIDINHYVHKQVKLLHQLQSIHVQNTC